MSAGEKMGYVNDSLGANETVVGRAYFHWSYKLLAFLALIFLFWLVGYGIYVFFARTIRVWTTELAVTNQRFIYKQGWLSLDAKEIALLNIEGVNVHQGFWGRMLDYGHIRIEGTGVDAIETPPIGRPVEFRRAIENAKFGGTQNARNAR